MKKITAVFVMSLLLILMVGCSTETGVSVGEKGSNTGDSISEKYELSSKTYTKEFSLKDGEATTVAINVVTENGKINIEIVDDKGDSIYSGSEIPTSAFDVKVDKSGKYYVVVETKEHKGSFDIKWNINK